MPAATRLGPYEVIGLLGAGGMGEVYRARDPRLGREVAIKVLPEALRTDPERLRRFEQEARAAGALNHPNVLAVLDVGTHEGVPYVVSELLEGETLRERLRVGGLTPTKAIDCGVQIALGLAAAHQKGIVHRDLKPENLFLTKDGRAKILDFGLAKLREPRREGEGGSEPETRTRGTEPGTILGTVGYMSPEQVRGHPADHRSDIFSLGAVLYEMLSKRRAFAGESAPEVLTAILKEDPPELSSSDRNVPPALARIVQRCLEKRPEDRFHSAHDLAFALEAVSASPSPAVAALNGAGRRRRWAGLAALGILVTTLLALSLLAGRHLAEPPVPSLHRLTFRRGAVWSARFAPDGRTVVYAASWDGGRPRLFSTRTDSPESLALSAPDANLLAISPQAELAIAVDLTRPRMPNKGMGTLAVLPLTGGAPRELVGDVRAADWSSDGRNIAVLRRNTGRDRLEFPVGRVLYEATPDVALSCPRLSPDGKRVAFLELKGMDASLQVIDLGGARSALGEVGGWWTVGLAWSPRGNEVWFTEVDLDGSTLIAADLKGHRRVLSRMAGAVHLHDTFPDGRVLMAVSQTRHGIQFRPSGGEERDLSWFGDSQAADLSPDGKKLLFSDVGPGGATAVYLREVAASAAVRLGEGRAVALSSDGQWAVAHETSGALRLLPTGPGTPRALTSQGIDYTGAASFLDERRLLVLGHDEGHAARLYVHDIATSRARPLPPEGAEDWISSPGAETVIVVGSDGTALRYPIEGGPPQPVKGIEPGDQLLRWSSDGRRLYVSRAGEIPLAIFELDLASGRRRPWIELMPADPTGVYSLWALVAADGGAYAYTYGRLLSDLYVLEGLR